MNCTALHSDSCAEARQEGRDVLSYTLFASSLCMLDAGQKADTNEKKGRQTSVKLNEPSNRVD